MDRARRRGRQSQKNRYRNDGFFDLDSKNRSRNGGSYKKHILVVALILLIFLSVYYYVYAPPLKFSKQVQHWYDSGYIYTFREFQIHYQDIPRNSKPVSLTPVLLVLHGFPTSSYDWKDLIPKFHKKFGRVIIPDLLGFGFSDKPIDHVYSLKEQATMIEELLNYLNITDVHLLAHDYGDSVAQELIARAGESNRWRFSLAIKSVCLTNGGVIPSEHKPRPIQKLLMTPIFKTILAYLNNQFVFNSRFSAVFGPDTQPSRTHLNEFWSIVLYKRGDLVFSSLLGYINERRANEKRWVGALQTTLIPLNLIYGPLDPINTPEGFLKTYRKLVPHSTVSVLENIGHYPQIEDEAKFIRAYNSFLGKVLGN